MTPKKELLEKLQNDGTHIKVDKRVSAAFLLMNLARTYIDEADELLSEYGLSIGETKRNLNMAHKSYERFASGIRTIIDHGDHEKKLHLFCDYEELEKMVTAFITNENQIKQI